MIKIIILQLALSLCGATLFGQKFTAVEVSTTTPLREALRICKNVGELGWFYSLDYDEHSDSFSILLHPLTPTIKIEIVASAVNLKSYTNALSRRLGSAAIGKYREGQGLAIQRTTDQSPSLVNHWAEYPINKTETYPPGVYEFYQLFKRNKIEPFGLNLTRTADSLFTVSFADSLPDDKLRAEHWSVISRGRGVLSYKGSLYYVIEYPFCVPLVKRSDTFCFHIHHSLPSLYYLDQAREQESLSVMPGGYPGSVAELSFEVLESAAHTGRVKALLKKGLTDPAHRDCYLDLDTGVVKNL